MNKTLNKILAIFIVILAFLSPLSKVLAITVAAEGASLRLYNRWSRNTTFISSKKSS